MGMGEKGVLCSFCTGKAKGETDEMNEANFILLAKSHANMGELGKK
jgi:hypothetical protein